MTNLWFTPHIFQIRLSVLNEILCVCFPLCCGRLDWSLLQFIIWKHVWKQLLCKIGSAVTSRKRLTGIVPTFWADKTNASHLKDAWDGVPKKCVALCYGGATGFQTLHHMLNNLTFHKVNCVLRLHSLLIERRHYRPMTLYTVSWSYMVSKHDNTLLMRVPQSSHKSALYSQPWLYMQQFIKPKWHLKKRTTQAVLPVTASLLSRVKIQYLLPKQTVRYILPLSF